MNLNNKKTNPATINPKPLISIITIVLNRKKNLAQTIESIIAQSYAHKEYIIIDGGSTDGTLDVIKKYSRHIDYWESEKDRGINHAINKGISKARGEIIGIVHSDDWLEKDALKTIVQHKNAEAFSEGVMYGNIFFWDDGKPYQVNSHPNPGLLKKEMTLQHPATFVSKATYEKYGLFDESFKYAMDYELLLRFQLSGINFLKVDAILANMSGGGLSDVNWTKSYWEGYKAKVKLGLPRSSALFFFVFLVFRKSLVIFLKRLNLHRLIYLVKRKIKG